MPFIDLSRLKLDYFFIYWVYVVYIKIEQNIDLCCVRILLLKSYFLVLFS